MEAEKIREKRRDREAWNEGVYTLFAVRNAVAPMFVKGFTPNYPERPLIEQTEWENSEEYKQQQIELVFKQMEMLKTNFELNKANERLREEQQKKAESEG